MSVRINVPRALLQNAQKHTNPTSTSVFAAILGFSPKKDHHLATWRGHNNSRDKLTFGEVPTNLPRDHDYRQRRGLGLLSAAAERETVVEIRF